MKHWHSIALSLLVLALLACSNSPNLLLSDDHYKVVSCDDCDSVVTSKSQIISLDTIEHETIVFTPMIDTIVKTDTVEVLLKSQIKCTAETERLVEWQPIQVQIIKSGVFSSPTYCALVLSN